MEKYQAEQRELSEKIDNLETKIYSVKQDENDVDEFIKLLDKPLPDKRRLDVKKSE